MFELTIRGNTLEELCANLVSALKINPGALFMHQPSQVAAPAANTPALASSVPAAPVAPAAPAWNTPVPTAPAAPAWNTPAVPVAPVVPTAPVQAAVPAPVAPVVPTAAPAYTFDQLADAGAKLAQTGKMNEARALLDKYNVPTISLLDPNQYGAFATDLRALGAQL